jgi:DtxR family transcriptional regulator, Mn-dependent transcriptional regulator
VASNPEPSATSTTVDRYLETIYCIEGEGETVRPSRLAAWLGVSAPTVSVALQRLARDGWIDVAKDRSVTLTAAGQHAATAIVRRHRVVERWLVDVLAFDWATADVEADGLAVALSDAVVDRLDRSMGQPSTCPHGNPIPGRAPSYGQLVALADLDRGVVAPIRRISEVAEHEARTLLTTLAGHGIEEGTEVEVIGSAVDGDALLVRCGERRFELPVAAASWIWVETPQP